MCNSANAAFMIAIPSPATGLKTIGEWAAAIVHRKDEQNEVKRKKRDKAREALMNAVITTRRYLKFASTRKSKALNIGLEYEFPVKDYVQC